MTKYATAGRPVRSFSKSWSWLVVFMHVRFHQKIRIQMVHTAPSPDKQGHKSFDLRFSASIKGYLPAAHTCRSRWHPIQSVEKLVILLAHPIRSDPMQQQPPKLAGLPWVNAHHMGAHAFGPFGRGHRLGLQGQSSCATFGGQHARRPRLARNSLLVASSSFKGFALTSSASCGYVFAMETN